MAFPEDLKTLRDTAASGEPGSTDCLPPYRGRQWPTKRGTSYVSNPDRKTKISISLYIFVKQ